MLCMLCNLYYTGVRIATLSATLSLVNTSLFLCMLNIGRVFEILLCMFGLYTYLYDKIVSCVLLM